MTDELTSLDTPSRTWGMHWLDCPICTVEGEPPEWALCDEGRALRDLALEDIRQRAEARA